MKFNADEFCLFNIDPKQKEKTGSLPFDKGGDRFKAPKGKTKE
jgi:hypothetical protein